MFRILRIVFSPTGGTRRVTAAVSDGLRAPETELKDLDLTSPRSASGSLFVEADLALIGVPVYFGRVVKTAADRLSAVQCREIPAVLIACYGNRAWDDSLLELKDLARNSGFLPFAAAAFIVEHSFSDDRYPIARRRPDDADIEKAVAFGRRVGDWMKEGALSTDLDLPGDRPFKAYPQALGCAPLSLESSCSQCGVCIQACPVEAIRFGKPPLTDANRCIQCSACVKACPEGNRVWMDPRIEVMKQKLNRACGEPRSPEFFFNRR